MKIHQHLIFFSFGVFYLFTFLILRALAGRGWGDPYFILFQRYWMENPPQSGRFFDHLGDYYPLVPYLAHRFLSTLPTRAFLSVLAVFSLFFNLKEIFKNKAAILWFGVLLVSPAFISLSIGFPARLLTLLFFASLNLHLYRFLKTEHSINLFMYGMIGGVFVFIDPGILLTIPIVFLIFIVLLHGTGKGLSLFIVGVFPMVYFSLMWEGAVYYSSGKLLHLRYIVWPQLPESFDPALLLQKSAYLFNPALLFLGVIVFVYGFIAGEKSLAYLAANVPILLLIPFLVFLGQKPDPRSFHLLLLLNFIYFIPSINSELKTKWPLKVLIALAILASFYWSWFATPLAFRTLIKSFVAYLEF